MNFCEDRHEPKYQITYKSSTPKYQTVLDSATSEKYTPVWLVCEKCMENKECFGSHDEIESVEVLA
jgi:hypothetical protein